MVWMVSFLLFSILTIKSPEMKILSIISVVVLSKSFFPESLMESNFFFNDFMSLGLIHLSLILSSMSMAIYMKQNNISKENLCLISGIVASLFFSSNNLMMMFISFESSLIPLLVMIIGWGKQPERLMAGQFIMIYTLVSSFPFLCSMIYMEEIMGMFSMNNPLNISDYSPMTFYNPKLSLFIGLSVLIIFLTKVPIFFLHSWLPKAHVEAPLEGSIILAGIMLKMGIYGIVRMIFLFPSNLIKIVSNSIMAISIVGSVISVLMAISSDDVKLSIALSSVSHMNFLLCAILSIKDLALKAAYYTMISHGLVSSVLFFFVTVIYETKNSRSIVMIKGLVSKLPSIALMSLIFLCLSIGIPPSLSFISEILSIQLVLSISVFLFPFIGLFITINSFFSMTFFGLFNHSSKSKLSNWCNTISFNFFSSSLLVMMILSFFFPSSI